MDSFNLPYYSPYEEEVREIVEKEGSFNLDKMEIVEVNDDPSNESGKNVANCIRAVLEPMLATHFGENKTVSLSSAEAEYRAIIMAQISSYRVGYSSSKTCITIL